jgi:hypothetical protein
MNNEVYELTLDELNEVSGGMDCETGKALRVRPETSGRIAEFSEHEAD